MLIENDNHFHTLYVVVRLSELDLKTWILTFSFENENGYRFRLNMSLICDCGKTVEKNQNLWIT